MATVAAVFALITRVDKEFAAVRALHELVELSLDKLMPVHFVDFALAHAHGTLTPETSGHSVERPLADIFLD